MIRQTDSVIIGRRISAVAAVLLVAVQTILGACGTDDAGEGNLTPLPTSPTTVATTMAPLTTSTTSSTTSTLAATTTTTSDPAEVLLLRRDGIGDVRFGVDPEGVLTYLKARLGAPDEDSGYVDAFSEFGNCPGTRVRGVRWGDLLLLFGDESTVAEGRLHFFFWRYGPAGPGGAEPAALKAEGGITLGSTVSALREAFPQTTVFTDEIFGAGFEIVRTLSGTLTGSETSGQVTVLYGGIACGG
ncbi:MAG: hypothetical protein ACO3SP_11050 [Ilumatobacteraceae bacterium]